MSFGADPIRVQVGAYAVVSRSFPHYHCNSCKNVIVEPLATELLNVQAAVLVHSEVEVTDPQSVIFARQLLGLSQAELAARLEVGVDTVVATETGATPITAQFRLALAGLLGIVERRLRGLPHGGPKLVEG